VLRLDNDACFGGPNPFGFEARGGVVPASGRRPRRAEKAQAPKGDAGHRNRRATKNPDGGGPPFQIFRLAKARRSFKEGPGSRVPVAHVWDGCECTQAPGGGFARRTASLVSYILPVCAFLAPCRPTKSPSQNRRHYQAATLVPFPLLPERTCYNTKHRERSICHLSSETL
jgi:hypothetical protein